MDHTVSGGFSRTVKKALAALIAFTPRLVVGLVPARPQRRLRLRETLSLGEKRFVAVVAVERQEFLVGGTGNSISLLACLPSEPLSAEGKPNPETVAHSFVENRT